MDEVDTAYVTIQSPSPPPPSYEEAVACGGDVYFPSQQAAPSEAAGENSHLFTQRQPGWEAKTREQYAQPTVITQDPNLLYWQQQQQQQEQEQQASVVVVTAQCSEEVSFTSALCLSCCVMLCICCPIGLAAFVVAQTGVSALKSNNVAEAKRLQKTSLTTSYFGIFVGLAITIMYLAMRSHN
jgi:hypothetical protein